MLRCSRRFPSAKTFLFRGFWPLGWAVNQWNTCEVEYILLDPGLLFLAAWTFSCCQGLPANCCPTSRRCRSAVRVHNLHFECTRAISECAMKSADNPSSKTIKISGIEHSVAQLTYASKSGTLDRPCHSCPSTTNMRRVLSRRGSHTRILRTCWRARIHARCVLRRTAALNCTHSPI